MEKIEELRELNKQIRRATRKIEDLDDELYDESNVFTNALNVFLKKINPQLTAKDVIVSMGLMFDINVEIDGKGECRLFRMDYNTNLTLNRCGLNFALPEFYFNNELKSDVNESKELGQYIQALNDMYNHLGDINGFVAKEGISLIKIKEESGKANVEKMTLEEKQKRLEWDINRELCAM